jgi:hypothetical protein
MDRKSQRLVRKYVFKDHEALWSSSVCSEGGAISKRGDRHRRMLLISCPSGDEWLHPTWATSRMRQE